MSDAKLPQLRLGERAGDLKAFLEFAKQAPDGSVALDGDGAGSYLYIKPASAKSSSSSALSYPEVGKGERELVALKLGEHFRQLAKASGIDSVLADTMLANIRQGQAAPKLTSGDLKVLAKDLGAANAEVSNHAWMQRQNIPPLDRMLKMGQVSPALGEVAKAFGGADSARADQAAKGLARELARALGDEIVGLARPDSIARLMRSPLPYLDSDLATALNGRGLDATATNRAVDAVMGELESARVQRGFELAPPGWGLARASVDTQTNQITFADGRKIQPTQVFADASAQNHVARYPIGTGTSTSSPTTTTTTTTTTTAPTSTSTTSTAPTSTSTAPTSTSTTPTGTTSTGTMVVKRMGSEQGWEDARGRGTVVTGQIRRGEPRVEQLADALREVQASVLAAKSGNPHLLGGVQHAMTPNGQILIFIRDMPGGTAEGLAAKLAQARSTLPPERIERIALTMTKDMLTGVAALHQEGLAHLDLKPKNMFIDRFGNGVVADFGSARDVQELRQGDPLGVSAPLHEPPDRARQSTVQTNLPGVDSPLYKAPEFIVQTNLSGSSEKRGARADQLRATLETEHAPILTYARERPGQQPHSVGQAADIFSVAISGYEMLKGATPPFEGSEFSEIENSMAYWSGVNLQHNDLAGSAALFGLRGRNASALPGLEGTTNPVEAFLNQLGHRDPAQRPSAQEALRHPVMQGLSPHQEAQAREDVRSLLGL